MGPGLASAPPRNRDSKVERGGREMVGREEDWGGMVTSGASLLPFVDMVVVARSRLEG